MTRPAPPFPPTCLPARLSGLGPPTKKESPSGSPTTPRGACLLPAHLRPFTTSSPSYPGPALSACQNPRFGRIATHRNPFRFLRYGQRVCRGGRYGKSSPSAAKVKVVLLSSMDGFALTDPCSRELALPGFIYLSTTGQPARDYLDLKAVSSLSQTCEMLRVELEGKPAVPRQYPVATRNKPPMAGPGRKDTAIRGNRNMPPPFRFYSENGGDRRKGCRKRSTRRYSLLLYQVQDRTSLMWACTREYNIPVIDRRISYGANLQLRDGRRRNALIWALEYMVPDMAYRLIEAGISVDGWMEDERTPGQPYACGLSIAVSDDIFLDCTRLILQQYTELSKACLKLCFRKALIQALKQASQGHNLYPRVKEPANTNTVRFFIKNGIGQGTFSAQDWTELGEIVGDSFKVEVQQLPIHLAAGSEMASCEILKWIVAKQPETIVARYHKGRTPLDLAAKGGAPSSREDSGADRSRRRSGLGTEGSRE
ncbi:hypothetical protein F4780DRAFT_202620 [Xylariomycetidae sp. FL0641]|nr:hypothetical protein F4780DRAFT_202620 [Xylariomycetidae sp. FL0641]